MYWTYSDSDFKVSRRGFLCSTAAAGLALKLWSQEALAVEEPYLLTMDKIRLKTLGYIETMRLQEPPYGRYVYSAGICKPTLYSSTYAAMTRRLYRDLKRLTETQRRQWIEYIQSHQDDDGLFRDRLIYDQGWYKNDPLWCGWPHLSCHVLTALTGKRLLPAPTVLEWPENKKRNDWYEQLFFKPR